MVREEKILSPAPQPTSSTLGIVSAIELSQLLKDARISVLSTIRRARRRLKVVMVRSMTGILHNIHWMKENGQ
jgi:hypothetical protein